MTMPEDLNFWQDYALQASPQAAYYSSAPFGGGYSPASQQYWSGQYGNVMNQYAGELGRSMRAGEAPTMTFTDYLEQYPWTERYTAMSPTMRPGGRTSRYTPAARRYY